MVIPQLREAQSLAPYPCTDTSPQHLLRSTAKALLPNSVEPMNMGRLPTVYLLKADSTLLESHAQIYIKALVELHPHTSP